MVRRKYFVTSLSPMAKVSGVWIHQSAPQLWNHAIPYKIVYWNSIARKTLHSNQSAILGAPLTMNLLEIKLLNAIIKMATLNGLVIFQCVNLQAYYQQKPQQKVPQWRYQTMSDLRTAKKPRELGLKIPKKRENVKVLL